MTIITTFDGEEHDKEELLVKMLDDDFYYGYLGRHPYPPNPQNGPPLVHAAMELVISTVGRWLSPTSVLSESWPKVNSRFGHVFHVRGSPGALW